MNKTNQIILNDFLGLADAIRELIYENEDLREENKRLKENNKKYFNQVMEEARLSQQGVNDFVNAILKGEIFLNPKNNNDDF